jgi:hypothetical protein
MPAAVMGNTDLPPISAREMKHVYQPHSRQPKLGPKPPPRKPPTQVHPQYLSKHHRRMAAAMKEGPEVLMATQLWEAAAAGALQPTAPPALCRSRRATLD